MSDEKLTPTQRKARKAAIESMKELLGDEKLALHLEERIRVFSGNYDHLEAALGALLAGRLMGWQTMRIIHTNATMNRMEKILDLKFREPPPWASGDASPLMEKRGVYAQKSYALRFADKVGDFWAVAQGGTDITKKQRRVVD
jgi:hypothetical protein